MNLIGYVHIKSIIYDCAPQVAANEKIWKKWFDTDQPEEEEMPDGYNQSLDVFRKLLMIRAWCPDRIIPQARKYIASSMGREYAEAVILNLEKTWQESDPQTPLVCLLSMGSDPTASIENLAKINKLECRSISMGQGMFMIFLYSIYSSIQIISRC